jgi:hypothetical protein
MPLPTDDVRNLMHMFRWIVKLIRDDFEVDEAVLTRSAVLETDCGVMIEHLETVLGTISDSFRIQFPPGTLDEVVKLDELCMLAAWMKGLSKRPEFISNGFEQLPSGEHGLRVILRAITDPKQTASAQQQ